MNTDHDMVSGFGSDDINNFGQDAFWEALNSAIGTNAELYNYDLSICTQIRAIILNKVQDTKLKTLNRNALVSIGTCKAGMYIKYDNRFWLIVGVVDNNSVYEKATMVLCNHLLTWLNSKGQVIQRWANLSSASQYNNGETSTEFYFVRSDQLLVVIPDDDESLLLTSGVRFVIDRRCEIYEKNFNDSVTLDTSNPIVTYKLTRADSIFLKLTIKCLFYCVILKRVNQPFMSVWVIVNLWQNIITKIMKKCKKSQIGKLIAISKTN